MPQKDHRHDPGTEPPHRVQGGWGAPTSVPGTERPEAQPHGTTADQVSEMESEGQAEKPGTPKKARRQEGATPDQDEHEGATEDQVGDRGGPAAGYDQGARQKNKGR